MPFGGVAAIPVLSRPPPLAQFRPRARPNPSASNRQPHPPQSIRALAAALQASSLREWPWRLARRPSWTQQMHPFFVSAATRRSCEHAPAQAGMPAQLWAAYNPATWQEWWRARCCVGAPPGQGLERISPTSYLSQEEGPVHRLAHPVPSHCCCPSRPRLTGGWVPGVCPAPLCLIDGPTHLSQTATRLGPGWLTRLTLTLTGGGGWDREMYAS
jgi:hypothetical protein